MTDFRHIFEATAPLNGERRPMSFGELFALVDAPKMAGLPWTFCPDPVETFELADNPTRYTEEPRLGTCVKDGRFYLGIFRRDGSALIASMPAMWAEGLAHHLIHDVLGHPLFWEQGADR